MSAPLIRPDGTVAFISGLSGSGTNGSNNSAILWGAPGSVQVLARKGSIAPGTGSALFDHFPNAVNLVNANASGTLVFQRSLVLGGSVTSANSFGVWFGTPGSINLISRTGDLAPGIGNAIQSMGYTTITANGTIAIPVVVATGGSVTSANNQAILVGTSAANVQLAVRSGDQVPNASAGVVVGGVANLGSKGDTVVFRGRVAGTGVTTGVNDLAIFTWSATQGLSLIAQQGNVAPGTGGAFFGTLFPPDIFGGIDYATQANTAGHVAFVSNLTGPDITTSNNVGLWFSRDGTISLVARTGDQIDLDAGPGLDLATLSSISFLERRTNLLAGYSALDDDGSITWAARFTDGRTAVFLSNLTAVPEPATLAILGAGVLGAGLYYRRRMHLKASQREVESDDLMPGC